LIKKTKVYVFVYLFLKKLLINRIFIIGIQVFSFISISILLLKFVFRAFFKTFFQCLAWFAEGWQEVLAVVVGRCQVIELFALDM